MENYLRALRKRKGAKLFRELCNADDPHEQDRLAKELDAHLMNESDPVVRLLEEWQAIPDDDAAGKLKAFRKVLQAVHDEYAE
jgi:hypothetical protein